MDKGFYSDIRFRVEGGGLHACKIGRHLCIRVALENLKGNEAVNKTSEKQRLLWTCR